MSSAPRELTRSQVAVLPSGNAAEVVCDRTRAAFCRWHDGATWSGWQPLGRNVADVAIAAGGKDLAHVTVTFGSGHRTVHALTEASLTGTRL